jgi:phosphate-selective porin
VFNLGVVVQTLGDLAWNRDATTPGTNGFSIPIARVKASGALDFGLEYLIHTDFTLSPALLDARLSYRLREHLVLDAGMFKAPFSAEFLISAESIDFVNRSQAVSVLRPGRQVGAGLRGKTRDARFDYRVGVFNGNGRSLSGNDNNRLMLVARAAGYPGVRDGTLEVGVSFAYNEDNKGTVVGDRTLLGADVRREWNAWLVSGEVVWADLDPRAGTDRNPFGYQVTVGYMIEPGRHQVLGRWDSLDLDAGATLFDQDYLILGYNFWPSRAFELQVNYVIPTADSAEFGDQQVLVNFQVAF